MPHSLHYHFVHVSKYICNSRGECEKCSQSPPVIQLLVKLMWTLTQGPLSSPVVLVSCVMPVIVKRWNICFATGDPPCTDPAYSPPPPNPDRLPGLLWHPPPPRGGVGCWSLPGDVRCGHLADQRSLRRRYCCSIWARWKKGRVTLSIDGRSCAYVRPCPRPPLIPTAHLLISIRSLTDPLPLIPCRLWIKESYLPLESGR